MRFVFLFFTFISSFIFSVLHAQPDRWQQRVKYTMDIDMDAEQHQYKGKMKLAYTNNSPDELEKAFFHLYFNAFQPGSMMDVRSRNLADPDKRVTDRISKLAPEEYGWIKVKQLKMNKAACVYQTSETILEVDLPRRIKAGETVEFEMEWDAQVPFQIRRSGRDNSEGIEFSMAQWYPKLCEYDYQGWHANPYVAREFYGVWGDFDVTIHMDKKYVVAAGAYLQNANEVGHGYTASASELKLPEGDKLHWHFFVPEVHDFVWAADPDYKHTSIIAEDGSLMRFFWQEGKGYDEQWEKLPAAMSRARTLMNQKLGKYPYKEYAFIQGGDGGMEYPLATLITGNRPLNSLIGVAVHEQLHTWYQMILGTNESLYGWMDEGFTSWAEAYVENELAKDGLMPGKTPNDRYWVDQLKSYKMLATSGNEEPLTTHADHFETNFGYSLAAYVKGAVFMSQLEYIIGKTAFDAGVHRYFETWKFKHPNVNDCIRIFEKESGIELDWYKEDWVNTTKTIDYAIKSVEKEAGKKTKITIERIGKLAMPLEVVVTLEDGSKTMYYAPLESMRGEKKQEGDQNRITLSDHRWVDPEYTFEISEKLKKIVKVELDPSFRMADINLNNNIWENK